MTRLRVLVACEFSGTVRDAFIARGHRAMSCDLLPSEAPGPHYTGPVEDVLEDGWDLMIAHPPCTYLASSGLHWNHRVPGRAEKTVAAMRFVRRLWDAPIPRVAIENPIGRISTALQKASQIIQPWQFGHDASKATCLWLRGLPLLHPTRVIRGRLVCPCGVERSGLELDAVPPPCPSCGAPYATARRRWGNQTKSGQNKLGPSPDRWKARSLTYPGIAAAMADQWGHV